MASAKVRIGVAFDGEKEARSAITSLNNSWKVLTSELEKAKTEFAGNENSQKALTKRAEILNRTIALQEDKVSELADALEKARQREAEFPSVIDAVRKSLDEAKAKLKEMKESTETSTEALQAQEEAVKNLRQELKRAEGNYPKVIEATKAWEVRLNKAQSELNQTQNELDDTNDKLDKFGVKALLASDKWDKFGSHAATAAKVVGAAAAAITAAAGAVVAGVAKIGMDFESAFAGVEKTVSGTPAQLKAIEDGLRDLAGVMPTAAEELAAIAENAGQLGIQTDNVLEFTETMAMMAETTNLSAEEAATGFAKFANITGMQQAYFDNLGSSVVALGNNLATTEADITEMAMRIAAAGSQIGMTEAEIMGVAAALSSVGLEAEAGGTAISRVMVDMQLAVETGSDSLKDFAAVAGMSVEEFKTAFQKDATGALTAFLAGLGNTEELGKSTIAMLDEMGVSEVRLRDTLLRAANANELFTDAVALSNTAFEENTALTEEANKRYETLESKLQIAKNRFKDLGITAYESIEGQLRSAVDLGISYIDQLGSALQMGGFSGAYDALSQMVPEIVGNLGGSLFGDEVGAGLSQVFSVAFDGAKDLYGVMKELSPVIGTVLDLAAEIGSAVIPVIVDGVELLAPLAAKVVDVVSKAAKSVLPAFTSACELVFDVLEPILAILDPILDAVGWLAEGLGGAVSGFMDMINPTVKVREEIDALTESIDGTTKSWSDYEAAVKGQMQTELNQIAYAEQLAGQLDKLVDGNGKVKESDRARAEFILGELNSALGTEYQMIDGIIQKNDELMAKIDEVIAKKKAQIIVDAQGEMAKTFLENQYQYYTQLNEAEAKQIELEKQLINLESQRNQGWITGTDYNKQIQQMQMEYDAVTQSVNTLAAQINSGERMLQIWETNSAALIAGDAEKIKQINASVGTYYVENGVIMERAAEEQLAIEERKLKELERIYDKEKSQASKAAYEAQKEQVKAAKERAEAEADVLEAAQKENVKIVQDTFKRMFSASQKGAIDTVAVTAKELENGRAKINAAGLAWTDTMVTAMNSSKNKVINTAGGIVSDVVTKMKNSGSTYGVGTGLMQGVINGIVASESNLMSAIGSAMQKAINKFYSSSGVNSPSRFTRPVGRGLLEGVIVGEDELREQAIANTGRIMDDVVGAFERDYTGAFRIPSTAAINASYNFTAANRQPIIVISQLDGKAVGYGVANYVTRQQNFTERSRNAW